MHNSLKSLSKENSHICKTEKKRKASVQLLWCDDASQAEKLAIGCPNSCQFYLIQFLTT